MNFTGQTGSPFKIRYQEHLRDFKYNNNKSKLAQHLIENKHAIISTEDIMEIVHIIKKRKVMDTIGLYVYEET